MIMEQIVLIDVTRLLLRIAKGKNATGVDRVTLAYITHFLPRAHAVISWKNKIIVLSKEDSLRLFEQFLNICSIKVDKFSLYKLLKNLMVVPENVHNFKGCYYFNINHKGLECEKYIKKINKLGLRVIFFIHDLIPISHSEYCRPEEKEKHEQRMIRALQNASGLLVNSQFTHQQLCHFASQHQLNIPPLEVAWLSCGLETSNIQYSKQGFFDQITDHYFVMLATIEPRKNHLTILNVWRRLVEKYGSEAPKLVIIGQRGWECEQVIDLLDRCEELKHHVIEIADCDDNEIVYILKNARALLFPSFVEGYGIPLVEALSLGVPVLASDIVVFREIAQEIPDWIDPIDALGWQQYIEQYMLQDAKMRVEQLERLKYYQHWQWSQHFYCVEKLIQSLERKS